MGTEIYIPKIEGLPREIKKRVERRLGNDTIGHLLGKRHAVHEIPTEFSEEQIKQLLSQFSPKFTIYLPERLFAELSEELLINFLGGGEDDPKNIGELKKQISAAGIVTEYWEKRGILKKSYSNGSNGLEAYRGLAALFESYNL